MNFVKNAIRNLDTKAENKKKLFSIVDDACNLQTKKLGSYYNNLYDLRESLTKDLTPSQFASQDTEMSENDFSVTSLNKTIRGKIEKISSKSNLLNCRTVEADLSS